MYSVGRPAEPLKNKTADETMSAFKDIILTAGAIPEKLVSDNGTEFMNEKFQHLLKSNHIIHETNDPGYHPTLGLIDRLSRTIKEKIFKSFTHSDNFNWVDQLQEIIQAYNATPHRALNETAPNDAQENMFLIQDINKNKNVRPIHSFSAGDLVRKRLKKATFTKGYRQSWSSETHIITKISGLNAILDNDEKVKLNDLQIIREPTERAPKVSKVKAKEKKMKVKRKLKEDGIDENFLVDSERTKKQVTSGLVSAASRLKPSERQKQPKKSNKERKKAPLIAIVKKIHSRKKIDGHMRILLNGLTHQIQRLDL